MTNHTFEVVDEGVPISKDTLFRYKTQICAKSIKLGEGGGVSQYRCQGHSQQP